MARSSDTWAVALTRCYFCGEGDRIVIPRVLTSKVARAVDSLDRKVCDMEPCAKCAAWMKQGVLLITIDDAKSAPGWEKEAIPNPHRTGGWFVVKDEAVRRMPLPPDLIEYACRARWIFIEHAAAQALGLLALPEKLATPEGGEGAGHE